jgi:opacity protein-like surface antigen
MLKRMLLALGAALVCAGATVAQPSAVPTPAAPALPPFLQPGYGEPPPTQAPSAQALSSPPQPPEPSHLAAPGMPCSQNDDGAFWCEADGLYARLRAVTLPPLVTTSPAGTSNKVAGILGNPGTTTVFGGGPALESGRPGFHVAAGYWFGSDHRFGIEGDFTWISGESTNFSASSSTFPILARPYIDASNFTPQAVLVAFPGASTGSIAAQATSDSFVQAHLDLAARLLDDGGPLRATALLGYSFFHYSEALHVQQTIVPTPPAFQPGTQFSATDDFTTRNQFNGFDFGLRPQYSWNSLTLDLSLRVAIGLLEHDATVSGSQTVVVPGQPTATQNFGVLAQPFNVGSHPSNDWAVIPQVGAGLSWRLNPNVQLRLDYSAIFLNGVFRAADQVNTNLNPNFFPGGAGNIGPALPVFNLSRTDIWIQSVSAGVVITY